MDRWTDGWTERRRMKEWKERLKDLPKYLQVAPGVEFEGPLGLFWDTGMVPLKFLLQGIKELFEEAENRGFESHLLIEMIKEVK